MFRFDSTVFKISTLRPAIYLHCLSACVIVTLSGCLTVPPVDFTVQDVGVVSDRKNAELISLTVGFAPQAQQKKVQANATIPPLWKESLQDAINRSLIFIDDADRKINLSARITEFDIPGAGGAMKTRVGAIYEIVDRANGDLLFAQEISSEGVVPFDYAFTGVTRAVESWNRAVRNNIADFINILEQTDISMAAFPATQVTSTNKVESFPKEELEPVEVIAPTSNFAKKAETIQVKDPATVSTAKKTENSDILNAEIPNFLVEYSEHSLNSHPVEFKVGNAKFLSVSKGEKLYSEVSAGTKTIQLRDPKRGRADAPNWKQYRLDFDAGTATHTKLTIMTEPAGGEFALRLYLIQDNRLVKEIKVPSS